MSTATTTRSATLDEALRLADEGRQVFMLAGSKRPAPLCDPCRVAGDDHDREACDHLTCHGFYAATSDPDRIRAIVRAIPGGMLAVRTGARSGIVVVDLDPGNGGNMLDLAARHHVPRTAWVRTGSAGLHLWYRHPGVPVPNSAGRLTQGVDVRGDGGYVVVPPAIHPRTRRPYEWGARGPTTEMPESLVAASQPPPRPEIPAQTGSLTAGDIARPERLLDAHLAAVARAAPGTRRVTLYGSARGVGRMVLAGAIRIDDAVHALTRAGRGAKQSERDIRRAIEGGFRAEGLRW